MIRSVKFFELQLRPAVSRFVPHVRRSAPNILLAAVKFRTASLFHASFFSV